MTESKANLPRLRDEPATLQRLIADAASWLDVSQEFVEKDFWATELLRAISTGTHIATSGGGDDSVRVIFKGGTSLSRAYRIIERFSEDIDILVVFPKGSSIGARDKAMKRFTELACVHLGLAPQDCEARESTRGVKRNTRFRYPRAYPNLDTSETLLLEMGSRGGPYPTHQRSVTSTVAEYALAQLGEGPEVWEEFAPVSVEVLAPERTLLEKLELLHDLAVRFDGDEKARNSMALAGRHYYDIHCLLRSEDIRKELEKIGHGGVSDLVDDINSRSESAGWSFTDRPARGFAQSLAFVLDSPSADTARRSYDVASSMIFGEVPSFDACVETVRKFGYLL